MLDGEPVETLHAICLQKVDDLPVGQGVPVLVVEKLDVDPFQGACGRCPEMIPEHRPLPLTGGRAPLRRRARPPHS